LCIAKSKIKIRSVIKYVRFQFTAVCSHTQSASFQFLVAEVTFVGNSTLNRKSGLRANIDIGSKVATMTKGIYIGHIKNNVKEFCLQSTKGTGCSKQSYERCSLKVIMFIVLR